MRLIALVITSAAVALAGAAPSLAAWSAPRPVPLPDPAVDRALAIDAHGDTVVAWASPASGAGVQSHFVAVTTVAPDGAIATRRIWSGKVANLHDVAAGIDHRGEVTVAWVAGRNVRAAYGTIGGRWVAPQLIARGLHSVHIAVARSGEVLLAWRRDATRDRATAGGRRRIAVAWRRPGHRFSALADLARPAITLSPDDDVVPAFDWAGNAYLTNPCSGTVAVAPARTERFSRAVTLQVGATVGLRLSVVGNGSGLAAWSAGACVGGGPEGGNEPGPIFVSEFFRGAFVAPRALTPLVPTLGAIPVALGNRRNLLSWLTGDAVWSAPVVFHYAQLPAVVPNGMVPTGTDAGGDQLVSELNVFIPATRLPGGSTFAVRPAGGGPDQASPAAYASNVATATTGRRVAILWNTGPQAAGGDRIMMSTWAP